MHHLYSRYILPMATMFASIKKVGKDISGNWMDPKILGITFTFVFERVFDRALRYVGSATD